jgi:CrcB protein
VNVLGCLLAGFLFVVMQERFLTSEIVRTTLLIGLLGGFTTFSSFGLQTLTLVREGEFFLAAINVVASNLLALLAVWVGYSFGKLF